MLILILHSFTVTANVFIFFRKVSLTFHSAVWPRTMFALRLRRLSYKGLCDSTSYFLEVRTQPASLCPNDKQYETYYVALFPYPRNQCTITVQISIFWEQNSWSDANHNAPKKLWSSEGHLGLFAFFQSKKSCYIGTLSYLDTFLMIPNPDPNPNDGRTY